MHPTKTSQPLPSLLSSLYKEYTELAIKLGKLSELITTYGGEVPKTIEAPVVQSEESIPQPSSLPLQSPKIPLKTFLIDTTYPFKGSWKAKIFFALKFIGKPSTVIEIERFILEKEPTEDVLKIHRTITQYTSNLSKAGELGVDSSDYKNLYFLQS